MPDFPCKPWRSVWVPRAVTAAALLVGVPLFLRMPPWCDITLYQMAARNLLHGGVHYRDLFDTNLPGFVWAMTAIQAVFGPSVFAVRAADLLMVLGIVLLIDRLAKWGGATPAARWWAFAGAAIFYPFTVEMSHAQRDAWMALPGLAAVVLRVRRGIGIGEESVFKRSFLEGTLWGMGVWVKPHIVLMAAAVWLLSARRLAGERARPWRAAGADLLGNLLGGLVVGLAGVGWLVASGAWPSFIDVLTNWNPGYLDLIRVEFKWRVKDQLHYFPPWSLGLVLTVPLALVSVLDMAPWSSRAAAGARPDRAGPVGRWLPRFLWDKQADADARFARGVLGGLYLVWVAQAFFLQRGFQYAHVPETLLMLGVWASHRWAWAAIAILWLAIVSGVWIASEYNPGVKDELDGRTEQTRERYIPRHPIANTERLRLWSTCWRPDLTPAERYALWDKLRLHPMHEAVISWEELAEVAEFLRSQGVKDGEVVAWFDSPHAVYLMLDVAPGVRFMHVYTAISIGADANGKVGREKVMEELAEAQAKGAKFLVNDLEWVALAATPEARRQMLGPPQNPPHDLLPTYSPYRHEFPFCLPTVFRSGNGQGRYVVHRLAGK